jgi:cell division protein FtsB
MTTPSLPFEPSADTESPGAHRRNPRLLILLFVGLCAVFVAGYFDRLARLEETRKSVAEMRQQVATSRQRQANLKAELERAQDPYYLALLARDGIGLVQEGDLPVVVYEGPPPVLTPAAEWTDPPGVENKLPWQQWWELIFQ